jgi:hypothetical protein
MRFVRNLSFSLIAGCALLFATPAKSEGTEDLPEWTELPAEMPIKAKLLLPAGMDYRIDKQDYKCFSVPEYKSLLLYANEYQALYDWRVDNEVILKTFKMMGQIYDDRVENFKDQVGYLKTERSSLVQQINADKQYIFRLQTQNDRATIGWKIEMVGLVALAITAAVK